MASNWTDKGGYLAFQRLSDKLRYAAQPQLPLHRFVRDEGVLGMKGGDTVNMTRLYNLNTPYVTTALSETARIPETDWQQNQISVTLKEWGQAIPITQKFISLSDFDPNDITSKQLQFSMAKTINNLIANKLKQTSIKCMPSGSSGTLTFTTDGTDPGAWSRTVTGKDLLNLRAAMMDTYRIPPMNGEMSEGAEYVCACSQTFVSSLMADSDVANALNWSKASAGDQNAFIKGWVGNYAGIMFVLDTQNFATTLDNYAGEAVFFGDDAVVSATSIYPEIRRKIPEDYGRDQGVAWYGIFNYKFVGATTAADVTNYLGRAVHFTTSATPAEL